MTLGRRIQRLPLRIRLVASFVAVMIVVLVGAGVFVYWRVEIALDTTLNTELDTQASTAQLTWRSSQDPARLIAALPAGSFGQVLDENGREVAATPGAQGLTLLRSHDLAQARRAIVDVTGGNILTGGNKRFRVLALPLDRADGRVDVAVLAVRLAQRDEALRELLAQLAAANLLALTAASLVAYRLARAALQPVERYRARAEEITTGAEGVRLDVPPDVDDEISRLGHTLNRMLTVQETNAAQQRRFLADASHELRAPLTVLTSEVELALRRPRTNEEYERTLQQIAQDTARLVVLADQLLDLEHATQGGQESPFDLSTAAKRATERLRPTAPSRYVTCAISTEPLLVPLHDIALAQVLDNLIGNALRHGTGHVTVTVNPAGSSWVLLTISDEGAGPPPGFTEHAIERFRRADAARSSPGNGLGLAVVHTLVTRAGGELRMCSGGQHHRYAPLRADVAPCLHVTTGTHVTTVLPWSGGT